MYEELIKSLRTDHDKYFARDMEAADVIEKLTQKEKFHSFLWNTIQPNEMELYIAMYKAQAVPQEPPKEET